MSNNITIQDYLPNGKGLINSTVVEFFMTFNLVVCAELIGLCGLIANAINIVNFRKQGLKDSVTVTLTALAVSDFGALFFQLLVNILFNPMWKRLDLLFSSSSMLAMVFFYPHGYFIRVSGFITSFAAFERCLCVVLPMKVKVIMTKNVAIVANVLIFVVLLLYLYPEYSVVYLGSLVLSASNRSVVTFFYRDNAEEVLTVTNIVEDLFIPYITFLILLLCTGVIVWKLKSLAKWRKTVVGQQAFSRDSKTELSSKDKKTVVMLTTVSVIFVACLTPECVLMTVIGFIQDMKVEGPMWDVFLLVYSWSSLLETINCSVTIIVYYNMSTKYRDTLHLMFHKTKVALT